MNIRIILLVLGMGWLLFSQAQTWYTIPSTTINIYQELGIENDLPDSTFPELMVSRQITLGEFKKFQGEIETSNPYNFWSLPKLDSSICLDSNDFNEYLNNPIYENKSVVGVTWESAMNYCYWKTVNENEKDSLTFYYRLLNRLEWLALNKADIKPNDFNTNFSDWLETAFDESGQSVKDRKYWSLSYTYSHKQFDPPVLKRKWLLGSNYFFKPKNSVHLYG